MRDQKHKSALRAAANQCRGRNARIACSTSCSDEFANTPEWVRFALTDKLIDRLLEMHATLTDHGFDRIADCSGGRAEYGPCEEAGARFDLERIVVHENWWQIEAYLRDTAVRFTSEPLYFSDLFADVIAGRRYFSGDGGDEALQELVEDYDAPYDPDGGAEVAA